MCNNPDKQYKKYFISHITTELYYRQCICMHINFVYHSKCDLWSMCENSGRMLFKALTCKPSLPKCDSLLSEVVPFEWIQHTNKEVK